MVIDRLSFLVKIFLPLSLLAISLSVSSTDSELFFHTDLPRPEVSIPAPSVSLPNLEKHRMTLDYQHRVTLVHFWASWCLPCKEELPLLEKLRSDYAYENRLTIITIAADSNRNILQYIRNYNTRLPVLIDQYGKAMREFKVRALPVSYLVNRHGQILYQASGAVSWDDPQVRSRINLLLSELSEPDNKPDK